MRRIFIALRLSLCVGAGALNAIPPKPVEVLRPLMFRSRATGAPAEKRQRIEMGSHTKEFSEVIAKAEESSSAISLFSRSDLTVLARRPLYLSSEVPPQMKLLPLSEDPDWSLFGSLGGRPFFLPQIYTALQHFTGPCDGAFDFFKGSFSFQFILDVEKNNTTCSRYLYWIMQYRSFMRVKLYQFVPQEDPREIKYYTPPTESLFSGKDIEDFSQSFFRKFLSELERSGYKPSPFVLSAYSDFLIFGYLDNAYFLRKDLREEDDYKQELKRLRERVKRQTTVEDGQEADEETQDSSRSIRASISSSDQNMIAAAREAGRQQSYQEVYKKERAEGIIEGEIKRSLEMATRKIELKRSKWSLISSGQQQEKLEGVASTFMLPQNVIHLLWKGKEDEAREQAMKESIHTSPERPEVPTAAASATHPELPLVIQEAEPPSSKHQAAKTGRDVKKDDS